MTEDRSKMWEPPDEGPVSVRKPYNRHAGYIASRRSGSIQREPGRRGWIVIYDSHDPNFRRTESMDVINMGRWVIICETHYGITDAPSLAKARAILKAGGHNFCVTCKEQVEAEEYHLPIHKLTKEDE